MPPLLGVWLCKGGKVWAGGEWRAGSQYCHPQMEEGAGGQWGEGTGRAEGVWREVDAHFLWEQNSGCSLGGPGWPWWVPTEAR